MSEDKDMVQPVEEALTHGSSEPATDAQCSAGWRSVCCGGEWCFCGRPADRKVGETVFHDDPLGRRHELTAYVCFEHFVQMMGPAAIRLDAAAREANADTGHRDRSNVTDPGRPHEPSSNETNP